MSGFTLGKPGNHTVLGSSPGFATYYMLVVSMLVEKLLNLLNLIFIIFKIESTMLTILVSYCYCDKLLQM